MLLSVLTAASLFFQFVVITASSVPSSLLAPTIIKDYRFNSKTEPPPQYRPQQQLQQQYEQRLLFSTIQRKTKETEGAKHVPKKEKRSTVVLVVLILTICILFPLSIFLLFDVSYHVRMVYFLIRTKLFPCFPNPPQPPQRRRPSRFGRQHSQQQTNYHDHPRFPNPPTPVATNTLNEKDIATLLESATLCEADAKELLDDSWVCCICLEDDAKDTPIARLDCNHATHVQCLRLWLEKGRHVCCLCNAPASSSSSASSVRGDDFASSDAASITASGTGEFHDDTESIEQFSSLPSLPTLAALSENHTDGTAIERQNSHYIDVSEGQSENRGEISSNEPASEPVIAASTVVLDTTTTVQTTEITPQQ